MWEGEEWGRCVGDGRGGEGRIDPKSFKELMSNKTHYISDLINAENTRTKR